MGSLLFSAVEREGRMPEWEDGMETASDFLARMFLMGNIQIDEEKKTMVTVREEVEDKITEIREGEEDADNGKSEGSSGAPVSYEDLLRENDEMRLKIKALEEEKEEAGALLAKFVNTIGNMNEEIKRLRAEKESN